jgi:hypothetical protein
VSLLAVVVLAGCGQGAAAGGDFEGEREEVAQVLEDLQESARDGDEQRVCRLLARPLLRRLEAQGVPCPRAVSAALEDADSFQVTVQDVQVRGTTATARVATGNGEDAPTDTVRLVREGANWRIASLGE